MINLTYKRLLSTLLALVMTFSGLITLVPLEAKAASEYITNDYVIAETTRSIHVSFDFGRNITQTDASRLAVWLYKQDGTLLTFYDFDLSRRYLDEGTTVGGYSHTFNGLTPDTTYQVKITASDPDWSGSSDTRYVETPAPGNPLIGLDMGWRTATSVRLKGDITLTGTGPGPYAYLSGELKSNALVIVPKTQEPAGNLSVSDPNAVVVFSENWQEQNNVFDHYRPYAGLEPDTEYVAQAILTNIYDNTGYSSKVYFKTFAYPQIMIDEIIPRSYDAYVYADITVDMGDAVDSLVLYADDNDAQQPKDDPARISGSLVSYDSGTGTAIFHLSGLTVNKAYDLQVLTRSGAGEAWSQKGTFTTLPAPTTATAETQVATNIRNTKALMNATITDMGYSFVLAQGFVYSSVNTNPRRGDADAVEVTAPVTSQTAPSAIVALADELTPNTTYYFQSFVRNNVGTVYGGVLTFTTQNAPEVDTLSSTSDLTTSTVALYGEVISTGGLSPTLRGFVFSETANPTLGGAGVMVVLDSVADASVGQFDETLSGLSSGTTYYYKAFIHSVQGTTYGTEQTFTTASMATILPAVTTSPVVPASITDDSAPVSGSFTAPEGTVVTETGFVYSKFPSPTMGDINTAFIPLIDTDGSFETILTGLSSGATYYMRAYAENENGIGYGGSVSFTTRTSGEMTIYPPAVISSMTVDSTTANSVTVTMMTSGAAALGREIYYSSTDMTPTEGEAGVSSVSYSLGESGQKTIAGLQPNTTYYLRGHTNALGGTEYYGGVLAVTTDEYGLPVVTLGAPAVDTITASGAKIHYQINPNGMPVTKTAVFWSRDITVPALGADGVETDEEDLYLGTTVITSHSLTSLTSNTTYYYAVYAYNEEGWSCSTAGSFTTLAGETPVVAVIDVDPSADSAFVNAQMTQDGTGSNLSYGLGVLAAEVDNATFATPGILVYRAPDVSTAPFTADFTGLSPSTQYYARAFACSIDDVYYYGAVVPFTTQAPPLASVALYGPENISATAADFLISVLDGGGNPINARGLVYGETALPDLGDNVIVSTEAGTTPGQTSAQLAGLTTGTKYYVRAYATTANGTAYSDQITLTPRETILPPTTTYTVTFDANGGEGTMSPQTFTEGVAQALTANAFNRSGHTFNGWATSPAGGVIYTDGQSDTITASTTLYAVWTSTTPATYTVTFDPNGGTCSTLTATTNTTGRLSSLPAAARSGYSFDGWYSAATGGARITTSTMFSANTTVFAYWTSSGAPGGTSGSGGGTPTPPANLSIDSGGVVTARPELDTSTGKATVDFDNDTLNTALGRIAENSAGNKIVEINVPSTEGAAGFEIFLPSDILSGEASIQLRISTDVATVTLPGNMLTQGGNEASELTALSVTRIDASQIANEKTRQLIGNRPVIQLTLTLDGEKTDWNNPKAPVTVTIPYVPTAAELANSESIVIWYIDGSGNAISVPNGYYDRAAGTVTFTTTHFSDYAVSYNKVNFSDVVAGVWYSKTVNFIAARDITKGTGSGMYSPDAKLTRGEFIVLLMRAYGIAPDTNITDNFADAGNTYYTNCLAAAKRLGISAGVGNNMYAPGKEITRQEMFTLLYNALQVITQLPRGNSGKTLSNFTDAGQINSWAKEAMTLLVETGTVGGYDGKLHPTGTTTRAEMAQVLYNLLGK